MGNALTNLLAFVVAISVLVAIHEFGHYIVGRWLGMKVLRFSIGFGKPIFTWVRGKDQTEYCVSAIPLGGYVRFLDGREGPHGREIQGPLRGDSDQRCLQAREDAERGHAMKVLVLGATGLAGSAICRRLEASGDIVERAPRSSALDLRCDALSDYMRDGELDDCDAIVLAAARVGGIGANSERPWDFIADNIVIQQNAICAVRAFRIPRFVFLGSSCIYPKNAPTPIAEKDLMTGPLEETNRAYAVAKLAGIEMCRAHMAQHGTTRFICPMPCNLYGPGDNYGEDSHAFAAIIAKICEAAARDDE
ncbi:MAG: NAD-dependent epimerase/dehydratase family protein, partial [Proteobacteria bacterium]|nr:NAD-dependent epimerase/dehydratase family protein [Pseudomonadota bacterium]